MITETFGQHRYLPVPMETRGVVASWDRWSDRLELVISGQGAHEVRLFYSRYFGVPEDRIRVVMGDVGGSFGQKVFPVNDEIAVVAAALYLDGDRVYVPVPESRPRRTARWRRTRSARFSSRPTTSSSRATGPAPCVTISFTNTASTPHA